MIGLDTNVLVRHLVQDDPDQAGRASRLVEQELSAGNPGYVSAPVVVELVWVLRRSYRFSRENVAVAIERLLQVDSLFFEHQDQIFVAMRALKAGHDFADALIGALGQAAGCEATVTFDKGALRLPDFAPA